jgi:cell division protein FtsI (penicillin-binding protein 3)
MKYIASFAGYFPADNPKYTCIVVINQPETQKAFMEQEWQPLLLKKLQEKYSLKHL